MKQSTKRLALQQKVYLIRDVYLQRLRDSTTASGKLTKFNAIYGTAENIGSLKKCLHISYVLILIVFNQFWQAEHSHPVQELDASNATVSIVHQREQLLHCDDIEAQRLGRSVFRVEIASPGTLLAQTNGLCHTWERYCQH